MLSLSKGVTEGPPVRALRHELSRGPHAEGLLYSDLDLRFLAIGAESIGQWSPLRTPVRENTELFGIKMRSVNMRGEIAGLAARG